MSGRCVGVELNDLLLIDWITPLLSQEEADRRAE